MKRILLPALLAILATIVISCGSGGGGSSTTAPTTPPGSTVNPSPIHGYWTISALLAAGPSGVTVNIYSNDTCTATSGKATLTASGSPDNVLIRVMMVGSSGRNDSDMILYTSAGRIYFSSKDAGDNASDTMMSVPQTRDDASSTNIPLAQKIDTTVFVNNMCVGVWYNPGNRLKLGIWQVIGGNSETKITTLISGYAG